ncbi:MAG: hypothetical protein Q8L48_28140 [Archangium sp.]|nr:hypothetical protein [Archangium sp.]
MQSLRDKLLKAGLVTEESAKKAEAEKAAMPAPRPPSGDRRDDRPPRRDDRPPRRDDRPPRRDDRPPRSDAPPSREFTPRPPPQRREGPPPPRREPESRVPKLPPLQGSKEAHRLQARKQVELDRAMRELVLANTVPVEAGATPFYFVTRKNKLRRLELTEAQAKRLELGELAVVERPDPDKIEHALVTPAIAEQLLKLSERAVRFLNKEGAKVGFLTDEEIHQRASEADAPAEPEVAAAPAAPAEPEAPKEGELFITIKRSPLT